MTRIAEAAQVSRSQLSVGVSGAPKPRAKRYFMTEDQELLPLILEVLGEHQTYGYRRICVLLNRLLQEKVRPKVNHKRVYRIMRQNNLLLAKHTGKTSSRPHTGTVSTSRSNTRWCSDGFEFSCDDGQSIRILFALDTCDREAIGFVATTGGLNSALVQDLMVECVEKRFQTWRAPHPVQWLSDNGPCYIARETRIIAEQLNLVPCFTPVRSPESNGLAEAFVKTFKRDYVYAHELLNAHAVLQALPSWFEDYNEIAPHKALRMLSPREFIRKNETADCPV